MSDKINLYQRVTGTIVAQLEAGAGSWKRPWTVKAGDTSPLPHNATTGSHYNGINVILLWCEAETKGYPSHGWATFNQWKAKGASVRKGEHGTHICFYKPVDRTVTNEDGEDETKRSAILKGFVVFNQAQIEGWQPEPVELPPEGERIAAAEVFFATLKANIRHGGGRAFYSPSGDYIQLPPFTSFAEPVRYYSTLGHETVHWTSHPKRADRPLNAQRFGDEAYSFEELTAELGAAFLCAHLGIDAEPREDHAAYLASWLKVLRSDNRAIFTAAAQAQRAVDWLLKKAGSATDPVDEPAIEFAMAA